MAEGTSVERYGDVKPITFGEMTIPEAAEALKKQKAFEKLAEQLLEDEDYMYLVEIVGDNKLPETFGRKDLAEQRAKAIKKSLNKEAIITKVKKKAAWLRLGLHLGITVPPGQEVSSVKKEIVPISDSLFGIKTSGPGYESMTILGLTKRPDGSSKTEVKHSEATISQYWPKMGRVATRSGGCSSSERKFSHGTHDIIAMAETRAASRCILALLGFGETSAEEFPEGYLEPDDVGDSRTTKKKSKPKSKSEEKPKGKPEEKAKEPPKEDPKKESEPEASKEPEGTKQDEEDTPEKRKEIVRGAASTLGGEIGPASKKILGYFDSWKKENEVDAAAKLSELNQEQWLKFKKGLSGFVATEILE